ncbi:hypothetical protein MCOR31_007595 [Pyricularia oryzae]|nr:hypothetical protein MCOR31_007595 [Pyricularia oryzae]KAI6391931.1 hypothetical protein MCOR23_008703 [Pyricularia oryzae]KAI6395038.1 hypothetical protein MCOR24_009443 [Pyricularia oryzae]KAI6423350.1 hypothetical protein MCOR21_008266 [Pyricularia oryzae]KAI6458380.1 hypothetical protein MCOR15_006417 [Pyricularia oryzae]
MTTYAVTSATAALAFQGTYALQPSAEVPLLDGRRLELLQAMREESMFTVSTMLRTIGEDYINEGQYVGLGTDLVNDINKDFAVLLTHFDRSTFMSIVRGTLGYDSANRGINTSQINQDKQCPGTYVVTLSIRGRSGAFLTPDELDTFVQAIQRYIAAVRNCVSGDVDDDELDWVSEVDNAVGFYGISSQPKFRWASGEMGKAVTAGRGRPCGLKYHRLENLADEFAKMRDAAMLHGNSGSQPLRQSPLYVGCSSKAMCDRYKQHIPTNLAGDLNGSAKTWGFTICLLRTLGFSLDIHATPVLCIYKESQLDASEKLVTALCRSFCYQNGYNTVSPGGVKRVKDAGLLDNAKRHLALSDRVSDNASNMADMANAQLITMENAEAVQLLEQRYDRFAAEVKEHEEEVAKLEAMRAKTKEALDKLHTMLEENKATIHKYHAEAQLYERLKLLFGQLTVEHEHPSKRRRAE